MREHDVHAWVLNQTNRNRDFPRLMKHITNYARLLKQDVNLFLAMILFDKPHHIIILNLILCVQIK